MNQFNVYNGVNHDVTLFTNPADYEVDRSNRYTIRAPETKDRITYPKQTPLNVFSRSTRLDSDPTLFYPDWLCSPIDTVPHHGNYDIIIVSSRYAAFAPYAFAAFPDYLDRLYIPMTIHDPKTNNVVGCVGFRKVSSIPLPSYYDYQIQCGSRPSAASMNICVNYYSTRSLDPLNQAALQRVMNYLRPVKFGFPSPITFPFSS